MNRHEFIVNIPDGMTEAEALALVREAARSHGLDPDTVRAEDSNDTSLTKAQQKRLDAEGVVWL